MKSKTLYEQQRKVRISCAPKHFKAIPDERHLKLE